jgi:2-polyprenyl-3-methyl-5-hydroxy-6-metoxy-1,4-benzoquinol methylase
MKRLEVNYSLNAIDVLVSLSRYNFVNRVIPDTSKKVLDFGCGSGYGTKVLKEHFKNVNSFDSYPDKYFPKNHTLITDIRKIKKNSYDIITCFEVIEHMDEKNQIKLINNLKNILNENGILFISTVRKMIPPPTQNRKKEHVRELSFEELYDYTANSFKNVFTFGQIDQNISTFYKENTYHNIFVCTK